jgi:hypothetical protein
MKRLYLLLLLCFTALVSQAQTAAGYKFLATTGTATDISGNVGVTTTTDISLDEAVLTSIPIGFTFKYCGTDYTTLSANSNGWLSLANSPLYLLSPAQNNSEGSLFDIENGQGLLMPYWDDLVGSGASAYYQVSGTAPFRVFTFQYGDATTGWEAFGSLGAAFFQVKLYETYNAIQFLYGSETNPFNANTATIGIANSLTDFQTADAIFPSVTTTSAFTDVLNGFPAANTVLTFMPSAVVSVAPSALSFSTGAGTNTDSQMVSIFAYNLLPSESVTVDVNTNFQIYDGSSWVTSLTFASREAAVGYQVDTLVAVRFSAPTTPGVYTGNLIAAASGATAVAVLLTGVSVPLCSATPDAGIASATVTTGNCAPYATSLSLAGVTSGVLGIAYQWQSSPDGVAAYTNVTGATNSTYAPTVNAGVFYRAMVTCSYTSLFDTTNAIQFTYNAPPAAITGNTPVCVGNFITLASTSLGGTWTSNNTAVATINNTTGILLGVSTGTVIISYQLSSGCLATTVVTVNTNADPIAGTGSVCAGASVTLTNPVSGGSWTSGSPAIATVSSGFVTGLAAGTTAITYTLANSCRATKTITVNALPIVYNVTGSGSYCAGGSGLPIGLSNTQNGINYDLYTGASLVTSRAGTGAAASFGTYTGAATYTAVATSASGCRSNMSDSAVVAITPTVTPSVSMSTTPGDTVCAGTAITFTASPVNGGSTPAYSWTVNSVPVSAASSNYTYTPANGDVVAVAMTSSDACPTAAVVTANRSVVVVVNQTPVISIVVGPNDTICQNSTAFFSVLGYAFGGDAPHFTWFKNGTATPVTGLVYAFEPANGDVVLCKLNSNYRCPIVNDVNSNTISMHIDSILIPAVAISTNKGLSIGTSDTITFTAAVSNGGSAPTYQWLINGAAISGATATTFLAGGLAHNDSVTCIVWGEGDCSYFTFNSVKVMVSNAVNTISAGNISVLLAPNPNNGSFTVNGNLGTHAEVFLHITDMLGRTVYSHTTASQGGFLNETIKLNNHPAGMYLLNVRSGNDNRVLRFVIKQ